MKLNASHINLGFKLTKDLLVFTEFTVNFDVVCNDEGFVLESYFHKFLLITLGHFHIHVF